MTKLEIGTLLSLFLAILSSVIFLIINHQIIFLIIAAVLLIAGFILYFFFSSKKEKRMYKTNNICQSLLRMGVSIRESNSTVVYTQDLTYLIADTKIYLQNSIFKREYNEILLDAAKIAATVKGEIAWLIPLAALEPYDKFVNVTKKKDGIRLKKLIIRIDITGAKAFPVVETVGSLIFPFKHFSKEMEEDFVRFPVPEGTTPSTIFWDLI
jgi:Ca2+/Na+ antiporter